MPTFTRTETCDARQFVGGVESAKELMDWCSAHDPRATVGWRIEPAMDDTPRIEYFLLGVREVRQGDWVILNQQGYLICVRHGDLHENWTQV